MGGWALWDTAPTHAGMGGHGQILALEHFPGHPVFSCRCVPGLFIAHQFR